MKKLLSTVVRAALLGALVSQSTGAADVAFMAGYAARPGLYPPPARVAPLPVKPAPAKAVRTRGGLLRLLRIDALLFTRWLDGFLAPVPVVNAIPEADRDRSLPLAAPVELVEAPVDRMLIVRDPSFEGVALVSAALDEIFALDYHPPVYQKLWEGPWREGRGVRFRINFFDVYGLTEGTADGFWVRLSRQPARFVPSGVPEGLRQTYPIYFHHDLARAEIEIQNTGSAAISGLEAAARQETITEDGQPGTSITQPAALAFPGTLAPGETVKFPYSFRLEGPGTARVNFEQTHLVVTSDAGVLANDAKAAIVDPPNP
ncbi:MAG: hypothetical protein HY077_18840 [Elusimicrobia bacterium]|nr:hypothetical protein [Elusimicrobiota bacterium]